MRQNALSKHGYLIGEMVDLQLRVGNYFKMVKKSEAKVLKCGLTLNMEWSAFVEVEPIKALKLKMAPEDYMHKVVSHVIFHLHPTFPVDKERISCRQGMSDVRVTHRSFGLFEMPIEIHFKACLGIPPITIDH